MTTRKITATDIKNLKAFMQADNGIVRASEWTTGSGRYTKRRATPVFVEEFKRDDFIFEKGKYGINPHHAKNGQGVEYGTPARRAAHYFIANPRVRTILVLDTDAMIEKLHGVEL